MKILSLLAIPSALMLACGLAVAEPTLKPGSAIDLTAVTAAEWLKGEAPKSYEPGKIYVFECWATWCGGCVANIPHLNQLHKKFHKKGLFVYGMDVWEKDRELAVKFVRNQGDAMSYPVAHVPKGAPFEQDWLKAAGVGSIPHAFVVKDGRLILSCHPGYLTEEAVTDMLNPGRCDEAVASILREQESSRRFVAAQYAFNDAEKEGDVAAMKTAIADCDRASPGHRVVSKLKARLQAVEKQAAPARETPGR